MSAYEELIVRCAHAAVTKGGGGADRGWIGVTEAILAEVLRTLEVVTPEMFEAYCAEGCFPQSWVATLRASPLQPPAKP